MSYTLHKPRGKRFSTLPVIVFGKDEQWQADLVDMQVLKTWNKWNRCLLTITNVLSKYAWAEPLKRKTGKDVTEAFQSILRRAKGRKPVR